MIRDERLSKTVEVKCSEGLEFTTFFLKHSTGSEMYMISKNLPKYEQMEQISKVLDRVEDLSWSEK